MSITKSNRDLQWHRKRSRCQETQKLNVTLTRHVGELEIAHRRATSRVRPELL